jgi:PAS domain S-box-containing protein
MSFDLSRWGLRIAAMLLTGLMLVTIVVLISTISRSNAAKKELLVKQADQLGKNLVAQYKELFEDLDILITVDLRGESLEPGGSSGTIIKVERFCRRHRNLLSRMTVRRTNGARLTLEKTRRGSFLKTLDHESDTGQSSPSEPVTYFDKGELHYVLPGPTRFGETDLWLIATLDPAASLKAELGRFYLGSATWFWLLSENNETIYESASDESAQEQAKMPEAIAESMRQQILEALEEQSSYFASTSQKRPILSAISSIRIIETDYTLVVSADQEALQGEVEAMVPALILILVMGFLTVTALFLSGQLKHQHSREAVAKSLAERQSVMDAATQVAIIGTDSKGLITYFNTGAERMLGYTDEEMVGRQSLESLHLYSETEAQAIRVSHQLGHTIEGLDCLTAMPIHKGYEEREWTWIRKDGSHLIVNLGVTAARNDRGELSGFLAVGLDVTDRKRAAEDLKKAKERTEAANIELESSIRRAQQLAAEAEAANLAKSEFLANMSHEIRTPMNAIIGIAGLLRDTELNAEQLRYIDTVSHSAENLLVIINDILDFSKIEAGALVMEETDFDLRETMEEVGETLAVRAHEKGLEYICRISPEIPAVLKGDPGRLRQVLMNITGNAIKFTASGEVLIAAVLDQETSTDATIRFTVSDTGIGIPEETAKNLFAAFTQADASTTRKFGGTGLGLAICDRLVKLMGGEIGVESSAGRGSSFWFTAAFSKPDSAEEKKEETAALQQILGDRRFLVVDDSANNRAMLSELLASWNCCAEEAVDGDSALAMMASASGEGKPYSVALIDLGMPEMKGDELAKKIHQEPAFVDTRLVLMTSFRLHRLDPDLRQAGIAAVLHKPVRNRQLQACLKQALGVQAYDDALDAQEHELSDRPRQDLNGTKVRVLLVEDNPTNQLVTMSILDKLGYEADIAENGIEAIKALETSSFDLVLMDVQMPEMDGIEATSRIRKAANVCDRNIPIVAMTAHAMKGDRERCLGAGMNEYLAKPFSAQSLAEVIERLLKSGPVDQQRRYEPELDPEVFDRDELLVRIGGDRQLLHEIETAFLEDASAQIESIQEAVVDGDASRVAAFGHALKSASAGIGANAIKDVAHQVEIAGGAGDLEIAKGLVEIAKEELTRFEQALRPASSQLGSAQK